MSDEQKQKLESSLWAIANLLRGKMNPDDYRDYILGFIFFKYLSEKQNIYVTQLLEGEKETNFKKVTDKETLSALREECLIKLGYFLEPKELFETIAEKGNNDTEGEDNYILDDLQAVLNHIEQSTMGNDSEEDFAALFEDLDLTSTKLGRTVKQRNEVIVKIINELHKIDFKLEDLESDVLGDAYEYLIGKFAILSGKGKGEFYTPQQVSKILAKIVTHGKTKIKSVYDPTCGSGSLLLRVKREAEVSEFFGQELNRTTYNLARMNMILHDIHYRKFDIKNENTLVSPQHKGKRFEAVVANPPFSAHWKGKDNPLNSTDERFAQYGKLAPKTKADYAFVQHMYHQLADNGTMAIVLPHGTLFRGSAEGVIRKYLIAEKNALDAVIGLPANIFYGTSIPTCILVIKKCRKADDNIVMIDASGEDHYIKNGNKNELRDNHEKSDINDIVNAYTNRKEIEKYCSVVSLAEIAENDYNLNIPRYVDTFEEEEPIDLQAVSNQLKTIDKELALADTSIAQFCKELNIPTPF